MKIIAAGFLTLVLLAAPSLAQPPVAPEPLFSGTIPVDPALQGTVRLTPEQREEALEYGASRPEAEMDGAPGSDGRIHGEVGVAIGTGGYRSTYGTAVVPLGESGAAAFSFQTDRAKLPRRAYRRP